jgi:hypothetical protein
MLKVEQNKKQAKRETIVCFLLCVVDRRGEVEVKVSIQHQLVPRSGQVSVLVLLASVRSDRSVKAGAL